MRVFYFSLSCWFIPVTYLSPQALIESSEVPGALGQEPNVRLVALYDNEEVSERGSSKATCPGEVESGRCLQRCESSE